MTITHCIWHADTADLLGFEPTTISRIYRDQSKNKKASRQTAVLLVKGPR